MNAPHAAGFCAWVDSVVHPRPVKPTDAARVRDGIQIALDGLGDSDRDRMMRRIFTGCHWLLGAERQDVLAHHAGEVADAAEALADFIGPADADPNSDEAFDNARGVRDWED